MEIRREAIRHRLEEEDIKGEVIRRRKVATHRHRLEDMAMEAEEGMVGHRPRIKPRPLA
jgi:hypothetical protein